MIKIAEKLQVPVGYLYCAPTPELDGVAPFERVAARASLTLFLAEERDRVPIADDELYLVVANCELAPRDVEGWRKMKAQILDVARKFEIERGASIRRSATAKHARGRGSS